MAGVRFELAMEPTAIGLVYFNSNSETHMTAICDARLIYGRDGFHGIYMQRSFNIHTDLDITNLLLRPISRPDFLLLEPSHLVI